jgi:hypothetical protein
LHDAADHRALTGMAASRRLRLRSCRAWGFVAAFFAATCMAAIAIASPPPLPPSSLPPLPPSGYVWKPELAPQGPVLIVIGIAEQRAWVYRNGVRIGVSAVSTGRAGHETPTGVFTILEKRREHYSNLYDNAPMPFMQRLTWDGVALHAGHLPGYPASHGCIRLPHAFSEKLFAITARGMTVVVAEAFAAPTVVSPGLFASAAAPDAVPSEDAIATAPAIADAWYWHPERAPTGPLTLVLSSRDREVVALRNAVEIGRAAVDIDIDTLAGSRAYVLLAGSGTGSSALVPGRPALRWLEVPLDTATPAPGDDLRQLVADGRLRVDAGFARRVYDALVPGTTVVVTDEPLRTTATTDVTVLQADAPSARTDAPPAAAESTPVP